jgi:hypothetical protein
MAAAIARVKADFVCRPVKGRVVFVKPGLSEYDVVLA